MRIILFLLPALLAAAISFTLTPLARRLAFRVGAVDQPGPRKIHLRPTARLGGTAVVISVFAVATLMHLAHLPAFPALDPGFFRGLALGVLPVLLVSVWDDVSPLPVAPRFAAHFAGAAIAVLCGIRLAPHVHLLSLDIPLGAFAVPVSLLWIVGVTNAFNIVDGLDGLSAGLALIAAVSLLAVALTTGHTALASASLVLAGALTGFLPHNVFPARIFLGDSGSTAIGFWLACLALRGGAVLSSGLAILVPILVIGVPLTDTLLAMLRRLLRRLEKHGGGLFAADREHIHHRLVAGGATHGRAVAILYGAGLAAAGAGLVSLFLTTRAAALLLVTLLAAAAIGVTRLNYDEFALMRRGVVLKIYEAPVLRRSLFPVFFDIGLVAASIYAAIVLKTDDWGLIAHRALALKLFGILPFVTVATFWLFRLYREAWRNAGVADFVRTHAAVAASSAVGTVVCLAALPDPPELTLFAIYTLVLLGLVSGSRGSYRFFSSFRRPGAAVESRQERVVIYGAGLGGTIALRETLSRPEHGMRPIGFIDDDPDLSGREVNGYPVVGTLGALPSLILGRKVGSVVIASPKIDRERLERLEGICRTAGVRVVRFRRDFVVIDAPRAAKETARPS